MLDFVKNRHQTYETMNDLKLFYTVEHVFKDINGPIELVTLDPNMNKIYGTDHEKLYEFNFEESLKVGFLQ